MFNTGRAELDTEFDRNSGPRSGDLNKDKPMKINYLLLFFGVWFAFKGINAII